MIMMFGTATAAKFLNRTHHPVASKSLSIHLSRGLRLGLGTALAGLVLTIMPPVADLENNLGLAWMFGLRGSRQVPPEVVIISIDDESSRQLGLADGPNLWPRSLHAKLVRKLHRWGARVIVFDVFFRSKRDPPSDQAFAAELSRAGNVILFAHLKQRPVQMPKPGGGSLTVLMDQLVPPVKLIADSALSYAPFPLPKVPARVNQAWLFKSGAADLPTIPVLALHQFASPVFKNLQHEWFKQVLLPGSGLDSIEASLTSATLGATVRMIRQSAQTHPELFGRDGNIPDREFHRLLGILKALYLGPDNHYIDFYGPPQTIKTIPYYEVFHSSETEVYQHTGIDFNGKAVFIGNSEPYQPDLKDDFHTVFSGDTGIDLSGVEIMATVFANLLEGRSVQPIARFNHLILVTCWGLAVGVVFYLAPGLAAAASAILLAGLYVTISAVWFEKNGAWMPLVTPLLFQLPLALFAALLSQYLLSHRESLRIRQTAGYFLPPEVVQSLSEWKQGDLVDAGRVVEGVCLASDAESFTSFAQNIEPRELKSHLNRYYNFLFQPVRDHGGTVLDIVGDAMLAFWENKSNPGQTSVQACHAAIEIQSKIAAASADNRGSSILPTRIGLHAGKLIVGNVGAGNHFEFRAVGDMINTTSRIEGLNKYLGTRILVSAQIAAQVDGMIIRRAGKFRLKGKDDPLEIFQLVCRSEDCDQNFLDLREMFLEGLFRFEAGRWREAKSTFESLTNQYGDGPSRFYLRLCDEYSIHGPPETWDGIYTLTVK